MIDCFQASFRIRDIAAIMILSNGNGVPDAANLTRNCLLPWPKLEPTKVGSELLPLGEKGRKS